ncbi:hypothetical protein BX600DRAFT_76554 [Xylariales sp. PMI_506]|nr:hypothetical protein BX600DRAFT_76554 [Xylariales sp. PMI_506]
MKPQLLILTEFVISLVAGRPQLPESRDAPGSGLNFIDETEFPQLALYFEDWILNDLYLNCLRSSPDELYKCNYKFHWYDPNFDEATDCNTTFHWDGVTLTSGPNNTYNKWNVVCSMDFPEIWQFSFDTVWSAWSFNMTLSRIHKDPK